MLKHKVHGQTRYFEWFTRSVRKTDIARYSQFRAVTYPVTVRSRFGLTYRPNIVNYSTPSGRPNFVNFVRYSTCASREQKPEFVEQYVTHN